MNTHAHFVALGRCLLLGLCLGGGAIVLGAGIGSPLRAEAAGGSVAGSVSNAATRDQLEGVRVSLPGLGLTVFTDNTGRYVFTAVAPGAHEITATYTGLDPLKHAVTVASGQRATRDFELTTGVYRLEAFTVAGEREGGAAAITAQRNAANTKNVVAMDSYGNLPNMSASELAAMLPGVTSALNLENGIDGFTVRGMTPGLNTITLDGALLSSQGGMNRQTRINNLTGAMFEGLELTKGHTPDKGADSLGGTINLKSRSPLSMKEKRRVTYNLALRWAPPFFEPLPLCPHGGERGDWIPGAAVRDILDRRQQPHERAPDRLSRHPGSDAVHAFRRDHHHRRRQRSVLSAKLPPSGDGRLTRSREDAKQPHLFRAFAASRELSHEDHRLPATLGDEINRRPQAAGDVDILTHE